MRKVVLHAGTDNRRAQKGQQEKKSIEPPALALLSDDPHTGLGLTFPVDGIGNSG
jgi:hypothetical protein